MASHTERTRFRGLLVPLTVFTLAGCAHSGDKLATAERRLAEHAYGNAVRLFQEVGRDECAEGDSPLCCRALLGEAEALLGAGERQAALQAFGRCRERCPQDLTVRRRQYLAEHALDEEPTEAERSLSLSLAYVLDRVSDDVRLIWAGVFLDGEPVGREIMAARPGPHAVEAEVILEVLGGPQRGKRLRLRDGKTVTVSRSWSAPRLALRLRIEQGADASGGRLELTVLENETPTAADSPPAVDDKQGQILSRHVGFALRESGNPPRLPPDLVRQGKGWTVPLDLCVGPAGRVERVRFVAEAPGREPLVDAAVLESVRRWRYGTYRVGDTPRGFCHPIEVDLAR